MLQYYSFNVKPEEKDSYAFARLEEIDASTRTLAEVCGRIRNKKTSWAVMFLQKASEGKVPVAFKKHNTKMGHRRELGGSKGRYPEKCAGIVLELLNSAIANARMRNLGEDLTIIHTSATVKARYPRMSPKGKKMRSAISTSRIEMILKGIAQPKVEKVEKTIATEKAVPSKEQAKEVKAVAVHTTEPKKEVAQEKSSLKPKIKN